MLTRLARGSRPLVVTGVLMVIVLAGTMVGLAVDDRVITGAPAWLKPAKFAASIAIYSLTLAWIFTLLPDWPRMRRTVGRLTAVTMALEMAVIVTQAWRGTTSHFNVATPLDGTLFTVMGLAIVIQTLSTITVAVAVWQTPFANRALGRALRVGVIVTIIGALSGGLMTRPTATQLAAARTGSPLTVVGAHTVGAPDGGAGLPGTGWSTERGDLRVPHFVGLHAIQTLPLIVWLFSRRRIGDVAELRLTTVVSASYVALFLILMIEALRGQPSVAPDPAAWALRAGWAVTTFTGVLWAVRDRPRHSLATRREERSEPSVFTRTSP